MASLGASRPSLGRLFRINSALQYPVFKVPACPLGGQARASPPRGAQGVTLPFRGLPVKGLFSPSPGFFPPRARRRPAGRRAPRTPQTQPVQNTPLLFPLQAPIFIFFRLTKTSISTTACPPSTMLFAALW